LVEVKKNFYIIIRGRKLFEYRNIDDEIVTTEELKEVLKRKKKLKITGRRKL